MSVPTATPLRLVTEPGYGDTAALNDIQAILSRTARPDAEIVLSEIADVLTRAGRPPAASRDIEVRTEENAWGWPVARVEAGDTTVLVGQKPAGPGLLIEITSRSAAEAEALSVTLDGLMLQPTGHPGPAAA
jgi:hypothetical protein